FSDALDVIKKSVSETFLPNTVESTTSTLKRITEERKTVLSCSMRLLTEGQLLLERLCEVATHSMGDSRPLHMQHAARQTSSAVEIHMESLQDRWRQLESLWNQKKQQLEQCLLRCRLELQMKEVEDWLHSRGIEYGSGHNLGDSLACSEILLHEHHKIEHECKEKQENCLRLVKSAEDLFQKGNYAGEELRSKSYILLSECSELISSLDQRKQLLMDSVNFFTKAQTAETKLDQIEIQLSTSDSTSLWSTVEECVNVAIQCGRQILSSTGMTEPGAQGVARKLIKWLSNNAQFFVQHNRDMGTTQTVAKAFLDQHESLQNDLRMKGMEIEALLRTVPNLVRAGGEEAEVVHSKSENLKQQWSNLRTTLDKRIVLAQKYLAFLKLSSRVSKEMDELESLVNQTIASPDQSKIRQIEEKQLALRQEILQVNNNGKNFLQDARKLEKLVDMQESQFRMTYLPNDVSKMEALIHDHESCKPTVLELFKFSYTEAQQLIHKINEAEPPMAAAKDVEKVSSFHRTRKQTFEKAWEEFKYKLEQHNQLCIFFRDMHLINKQIEELNSQLASIRQSYGESLPSALYTSQAFQQFEKTIEILQIRIYEFVSTAERLMRDQRVDSKQIPLEIETMQKKWSTFRTEVTNNRRLIDVAIEYYKTIEEVYPLKAISFK
ncbi:titin, partial [Trichonephila inaurata madagascariensis]